MYSDVTSGTFARRIAAHATLDSQGITGAFEGQSASGADAILATRNGRMGVKLSADGAFTAAAEDVLEADQYLAATLLGDEQDRRRRMLGQLFANPSWKASLERPHLLVWLEDWDTGFQFGEGLKREGETLLSVPLEITRPAPGTEMLIPAPLLGLATARPPLARFRSASGTMHARNGRSVPVRARPG